MLAETKNYSGKHVHKFGQRRQAQICLHCVWFNCFADIISVADRRQLSATGVPAFFLFIHLRLKHLFR